VDFYRPELRSYNKGSDLNDKSKKTILVMGDSFSVGDNSWAGLIRPKLMNHRVISAGMPGTGIFESLFVARNRFQEFNPDVFIYQIFVGNDIQDIRRPLNWQTMSLPRYIYCFACSYAGLRSLVFINYRLAQLGQSYHTAEFNVGAKFLDDTHLKHHPTELNVEREFSADTYLKSAKLYFQAEPYNLDDTIMVKNNRRDDFETLITNLYKLFDYCKYNCKKYVVVIPDSSQVNDYYLKNMLKIGASFDNEDKIKEDSYPFITGLEKRLSGKNIKVLNPLPLFKKYENKGIRVYYKNDPHLTPGGQTLLGEFILEHLERDQVIN
jgi:hypothetical protein